MPFAICGAWLQRLDRQPGTVARISDPFAIELTQNPLLPVMTPEILRSLSFRGLYELDSFLMGPWRLTEELQTV